jgi:hypothetical protein
MPEQQNIPRTRILTEDGSEHVSERLSEIAIVLENARERGTVAGDALEDADVALQARGFGGGQARRAGRPRGHGIGPIAGGHDLRVEAERGQPSDRLAAPRG